MLTQFVSTVATVYGVLAALKSLLQTRQMLARRSSRGLKQLRGPLVNSGTWARRFGRREGSIVGPWLSRRRSSAVPAITARG